MCVLLGVREKKEETFYVSAAEVMLLFLCYFAWKEKSCSLFIYFIIVYFFVGSYCIIFFSREENSR